MIGLFQIAENEVLNSIPLVDLKIEKAKESYKAKYGKFPKVYDVVISDGARKLA